MKVDLLNIPSQFNPRILGSASAFIIADQCLRNLVKIDEAGQLAGDLAERWSVSKDHREFTFYLRSGKFSNGDEITPRDVVESFIHPDFRNSAIHFDFNLIEKVQLDGNAVVVKLKVPNFNFLYHVTQPEFGIYHITDRRDFPKLAITSGPYKLVKMDSNRVTLTKNPNFPHDGPGSVEIVALGEKKYVALEKGDIDIALLFEDPPEEISNKLKKSGRFDFLRPHVGFTFWLTVNPNSHAFQNSTVRSNFQLSVRSHFQRLFNPTLTWTMASQLFLPNGPGRISKDWTDSFWDKHKPDSLDLKGKTLRGLISDKFQFSNELREALKLSAKQLNAEIEVETYSDQAEFADKLKRSNPDFYLINNDFSSFELIQNLVVTFNKSKPLITFDSKNDELEKLWNRIQMAEAAEQRYDGLVKLSKGLLTDALIVPLLYKQVPILKNKSVDLSRWSHLFPEFAFWKVRYHA